MERRGSAASPVYSPFLSAPPFRLNGWAPASGASCGFDVFQWAPYTVHAFTLVPLSSSRVSLTLNVTDSSNQRADLTCQIPLGRRLQGGRGDLDLVSLLRDAGFQAERLNSGRVGFSQAQLLNMLMVNMGGVVDRVRRAGSVPPARCGEPTVTPFPKSADRSYTN